MRRGRDSNILVAIVIENIILLILYSIAIE